MVGSPSRDGADGASLGLSRSPGSAATDMEVDQASSGRPSPQKQARTDPRTSLKHVLAEGASTAPGDQDALSPSPEPELNEKMSVHGKSESDQSASAENDRSKDVRPCLTQSTKLDSSNTGHNTATRQDLPASAFYAGTKMRTIKKRDGVPLWRVDIQYDFLRSVFEDQTAVFTNLYEPQPRGTFADIYIDAMAKSTKTSRILKDKLLNDRVAAVNMAMVCLLVNVGRMNTTLNFFPEMRAQLRTYHAIPSLQARQDANAYKQLQDAPRLKSILKGACEDQQETTTLEQYRHRPAPRGNPVSLIFIMAQYAPKLTELHFPAPMEFWDLFRRTTITSRSRARAFLWLMWWYLESDCSTAAAMNNPFGVAGVLPGAENFLPRIPFCEHLTPQQADLENVDSPEERAYGVQKQEERRMILAMDLGPAVPSARRARKSEQPSSSLLLVQTHVLTPELGTNSVAHSDDRINSPSHDPGSPDHTRRDQCRSRQGQRSKIDENDGSDSEDGTGSMSPSGMNGGEADEDNDRDSPSEQARLDEALIGTPAAMTIGTTTPSRKGIRDGGKRNGGGHHRPQRTTTTTTGGHAALSDRPGDQSSPVPSISGYGHLLASTTTATVEGAHNLLNHPPRRSRPLTQQQILANVNRKEKVKRKLDVCLAESYRRSKRVRESGSTMARAWKRIVAMEDPFENSQDESTGLNGPFRYKGLGGVALLLTEEDDYGEEAHAYATSLRRAVRRLNRWDDEDEAAAKAAAEAANNVVIQSSAGMVTPHISISVDGTTTLTTVTAAAAAAAVANTVLASNGGSGERRRDKSHRGILSPDNIVGHKISNTGVPQVSTAAGTTATTTTTTDGAEIGGDRGGRGGGGGGKKHHPAIRSRYHEDHADDGDDEDEEEDDRDNDENGGGDDDDDDDDDGDGGHTEADGDEEDSNVDEDENNDDDEEELDDMDRELLGEALPAADNPDDDDDG